MKILDSIHYNIDQLDPTSLTAASYYYTNYPRYYSTLSSKEEHFCKFCFSYGSTTRLKKCHSFSTTHCSSPHFLRKKDISANCASLNFSATNGDFQAKELKWNASLSPLADKIPSIMMMKLSMLRRSYNEPGFAVDEAGGLRELRTDDNMRRSGGHSHSSAAGQEISVESLCQSKSRVSSRFRAKSCAIVVPRIRRNLRQKKLSSVCYPWRTIIFRLIKQ